MSFPRHPKYKDSGVEWLGAVPEHWSAGRFSRAILGIKDGTHGTFERVPVGFPLLSAKNVQDGHVLLSDDESLVTATDHNSIVANGFPMKGDLLLTIVGTIGRSCVYEFDSPLAFQRSVCFIRLYPENDSKFFYYFTQSKFFQEQLVSRSKSAAQGGVYMGDVVATSLAYPSPPEQSKIAAFLDRETAKIDELVAEQRRLMELLKEKRQAVISHAVTQGLNPDAPMKPSGIEWLGDVPAHWQIKRIKHLIAVLTDYTANGSFASLAENVTYRTEGYSRLVRLTDLREALTNDGLYVDESAHKFLGKSELFGGEVLIANVGAYAGYACLMPCIAGKATLGPNMYLIRFKPGVLTNEYGLLCLMSLGVQEQLKIASTSTAQPKLNKDAVKGCLTVLPPTLEEQTAILEYLRTRTGEFDTLTTAAQRAIDLLQERRTALISAAVTGQIDVRALTEKEAA